MIREAAGRRGPVHPDPASRSFRRAGLLPGGHFPWLQTTTNYYIDRRISLRCRWACHASADTHRRGHQTTRLYLSGIEHDVSSAAAPLRRAAHPGPKRAALQHSLATCWTPPSLPRVFGPSPSRQRPILIEISVEQHFLRAVERPAPACTVKTLETGAPLQGHRPRPGRFLHTSDQLHQLTRALVGWSRPRPIGPRPAPRSRLRVRRAHAPPPSSAARTASPPSPRPPCHHGHLRR